MGRTLVRLNVLVPGSGADLLAVQNAAVSIYRQGTTDLPVMYANVTGGSAISNPRLSDDVGEVAVWLDPSEQPIVDAMVDANSAQAYLVQNPSRRVAFSPYTKTIRGSSDGVPGPPGPGGSDPNAVKLTGDQTVSGKKSGKWLDAGGQVFNVAAAQFGAVSGVDSTAAIDAAFAAADAAGGVIEFPPGNWVYNGTGFNPAFSARIRGAGMNATTITLGAGGHLINTANQLNSLILSGLHISGGAGAVALTNTGTNVRQQWHVSDVWFDAYTGAAWLDLSSDFPYLHFDRCIFQGANMTSTMGVAHSGKSDELSFRSCDFVCNRVHVKLLNPGNAIFDGCDFLRIGTNGGLPLIDIWVVPAATTTGSGAGLTVSPNNKFGNEGLTPAVDYRILYADEDQSVGSRIDTYWPKLTADSAGYVSGHRIAGSFYGGGATLTGSTPVVYSTTPNIFGCTFGQIRLGGTPAAYIVQIRTPVPTTTNQALRASNVIGPVDAAAAPNTGWFAPQATNAPFLAVLDDPAGNLSLAPYSHDTMGDPVGYINLCTVKAASFNVLLGAVATPVTDSHGGTDANEVIATGANQLYYGLGVGAAPDPQVPAWVEFDCHPGSTAPNNEFILVLRGFDNVPFVRWSFTVPTSGWTRYRRRFFFTTPGGGGWNIVFTSAGAGRFQIGRVRCYQSRTPALPDLVIPNAITTTTAPAAGAAAALPATPAGYLTVMIAGTARQVPYY